jgi:hypothetical protein
MCEGKLVHMAATYPDSDRDDLPIWMMGAVMFVAWLTRRSPAQVEDDAAGWLQERESTPARPVGVDQERDAEPRPVQRIGRPAAPRVQPQG